MKKKSGKNPLRKAKKTAKRKAKKAAQKLKIEINVRKRTFDFIKQALIDQRALMLASNRIANLEKALELAKNPPVTPTVEAEAPANGV